MIKKEDIKYLKSYEGKTWKYLDYLHLILVIILFIIGLLCLRTSYEWGLKDGYSFSELVRNMTGEKDICNQYSAAYVHALEMWNTALICLITTALLLLIYLSMKYHKRNSDRIIEYIKMHGIEEEEISKK